MFFFFSFADFVFFVTSPLYRSQASGYREMMLAQIKAFQPVTEQTVSYKAISFKLESYVLKDRRYKKNLKLCCLPSDGCHGVTLSLPSQLQMMRVIAAIWGPCERYVDVFVFVCTGRASTQHLSLCFSFIPASVAGCHEPISFNTLHLLGWIGYLGDNGLEFKEGNADRKLFPEVVFYEQSALMQNTRAGSHRTIKEMYTNALRRQVSHQVWPWEKRWNKLQFLDDCTWIESGFFFVYMAPISSHS